MHNVALTCCLLAFTCCLVAVFLGVVGVVPHSPAPDLSLGLLAIIFALIAIALAIMGG